MQNINYNYEQCHITNANQPSPWPFLNFSIQTTLFEAKMACIENIAKIQHRQINYQSYAWHNCDMLIKTLDLWWLNLSEVPPNPASIPSATSLAWEWLAKAIISQSILTLSGWWAGGQGFQTGTVGWLCYQGQCQILEVWEWVLEGSDRQTPTAPLWPDSGQLGTLCWAGRLISLGATDVAAPIAGLIGIGYVALLWTIYFIPNTWKSVSLLGFPSMIAFMIRCWIFLVTEYL